MRERVLYFLLIFLLSIFFVSGEPFTFSNFLPRVVKGNKTITINVSTLSKSKDFYIYYKTEGSKIYQVRKMSVKDEGKIYYRIPVDNLYGSKLEYFIVDGNDNRSKMSPVFTVTEFTVKESPEIYFMDANGGSSTAKKRNPFLKFKPSFSSTSQLYDNAEYPGKKYTASGNLRMYRNISDNDTQFDFDTNFSYMSQISSTESHINLTSMMIRFKKGSNKFEIGDVSISNTELTTSYLSRRGLNYEMSGKKIYLNAFMTNSQQKTGFDGYGIPPTDSNLFGATAGYNFGRTFKLRAMFLTGKDTLDSKTVVSTSDVYREGNLISTWGELYLFKNELTLKGEISKSNFGKGANSESVVKENGNAMRASLNYNHKILSASATYNKIGSKYNSIANLFLTNDKEGFTGNIGLNGKSLSFSTSYRDQKDYIDNPNQNMMHTKDLSSNFGWLIANHLKIGVRFGLNNLDYDKSTGLQSSGSDMKTTSYSGTLNYFSGSNSITLSVGKKESENYTSNIDTSLSLSLRFGKVLTFSPTASYTTTDNFTDDTTSKMLSIYLSSELSFVPQVFTLSMTGSYSNSESASSTSKNLSLGANLNFYMSKIFKYKVTPSLSLKSKYQQSEYGGVKTDSTSLYLQADLSF